MLDIRNRTLFGMPAISSIEEVDNLEWYGFDPYAPSPDDDGLSTVELDDVELDNEDDVFAVLTNNIDPLTYSNSFGIDLYMEALTLFTANSP